MILVRSCQSPFKQFGSILRIAKGFLDKKSVASLLRLPDLYYGQTTLYAVKAAKTLDRFPASLAFRSK